jgi:cytochrome P450
VVLDGVLYEKGWVLIAEPRITHHLDQYFQAPETFDPDRFLADRQEGKPYEYIPFGGGAHACLGAQMAMVIAKVFLSQILQSFDWRLTGPAEFDLFPLRLLKSTYEIDLMGHEATQ